jgi:hypothetical protein
MILSIASNGQDHEAWCGGSRQDHEARCGEQAAWNHRTIWTIMGLIVGDYEL